MHKANHPETEHYCESVWDIDPQEAVKGRKVGLCWLSPDCKHFSKAKGGKPVEQKIRGLAWVAVSWAIKVRPRVIMLENVEEFKTWGPLIKNSKGDWIPDPAKKGMTYESFKKSLEALGYEVEARPLRACDYGAPTIRKRLFMIARCDGQPITWPEPTHGDPNEVNVQLGLKKPYRTAAEIIDWSLPVASIFTRKKPLAENTMLRITRGIKKFIVETDNPYIVDDKAYFLQHYYTHQGEETRGSGLDEPLATIPTANRFGLVAAYIAQHYKNSTGHKLQQPLGAITTVNKASLVQAFLMKYYSSDTGQSLHDPLHTVTTKDRFGLITIAGQDYQIVDIGMRMLKPRELFLAQGFPKEYIIDKDYKGVKYPETQQKARVGNSVSPGIPNAMVRANLRELCVKKYEYKAAVSS